MKNETKLNFPKKSLLQNDFYFAKQNYTKHFEKQQKFCKTKHNFCKANLLRNKTKMLQNKTKHNIYKKENTKQNKTKQNFCKAKYHFLNLTKITILQNKAK